VVVALGYAMLNSPSEREAGALDDMNARITDASLRTPTRQSSGFGRPRDSGF
jgi:hypothetical protein